MLSDGYYFETNLDQECLEANDVLSAISGHKKERKIINDDMPYYQTDAGLEIEYYSELGLDVILLCEREVNYGSKALIYSYTDSLFIVIYYNDYIDRSQYRAFDKYEIEMAINYYMKND